MVLGIKYMDMWWQQVQGSIMSLWFRILVFIALATVRCLESTLGVHTGCKGCWVPQQGHWLGLLTREKGRKH